mmetsp:Transcript_86/g.151  ORF Transcript_86/g.151 Transcript_86/m.151 type:complete len:133 (+) Transcript_86:273-671(+)
MSPREAMGSCRASIMTANARLWHSAVAGRSHVGCVMTPRLTTKLNGVLPRKWFAGNVSCANLLMHNVVIQSVHGKILDIIAKSVECGRMMRIRGFFTVKSVDFVELESERILFIVTSVIYVYLRRFSVTMSV